MTLPNDIRIRKIIETIDRLQAYILGHEITAELIQNDYAVQWTVSTPLYNIGEHTWQLSKELKESHPEIPWNQISGMRHRLVHQYDDTNWELISHVVFFELQPYKVQLTNILEKK